MTAAFTVSWPPGRWDTAELQKPARPAACRNLRRCRRAVHRMDCSDRQYLPRPDPPRRRVSLRAGSPPGARCPEAEVMTVNQNRSPKAITGLVGPFLVRILS